MRVQCSTRNYEKVINASCENAVCKENSFALAGIITFESIFSFRENLINFILRIFILHFVLTFGIE